MPVAPTDAGLGRSGIYRFRSELTLMASSQDAIFGSSSKR
jgi:hypothetical protein